MYEYNYSLIDLSMDVDRLYIFFASFNKITPPIPKTQLYPFTTLPLMMIHNRTTAETLSSEFFTYFWKRI